MIAVRVLRDGVPVREAVFHDLPVTLGRGPKSDVVLFDPSVSRAHARLEWDAEGRLVLCDLGSRNLLFRDGRNESSVAVGGTLRVWLGRVEVEIEPLSPEATQEVRLQDRPHPERRRGLARHVGYLVAGVAALVAFTVANAGYWSPLSEERSLSLVVAALLGVILIPLVALGLFIGLKAVGRKVRLADTLHAVAGVAWLLPAIALLSILSYYSLSPEGHGAFMGLLALAAAVVAIVFLVGVRHRGPNGRFRLAWGLGTSAVLAAIAGAGASCSERFGTPSVTYDAQPPVLGWTGPKVDLETHLARMRAAASAAAGEAEEARRKRRID